MSNPFYTRRRNIGRAASPPTWACYEQIRYDDEDYSDSDSDSCSEDEEDYPRRERAPGAGDHDGSHEEMHKGDHSSRPADPGAGTGNASSPPNADDSAGDLEMEMDMGDDGDGASSRVITTASAEEQQQQQLRDLKGKQKAVEPEPEVPQTTRNRRHSKKKRQQTYTLRPILTIQRSQGFVWNQDLFVPPYIKDRYIASTSPPNSRGFVSASASSTNSALTDYEVEVVEIRIQESDIRNIIP